MPHALPHSKLIAFVFALLLASRPLWSQNGKQLNSSVTNEIAAGLVVEGLAHQNEGEKAGLREGDILLTWSRGDAKGEIHSPFDVTEIEIEEAPRGTVTLQGIRNAEKTSWVLGPDSWGIQVRPILSEGDLSIYSEVLELRRAGKLAQAEGRWRALVEQTQSPGQPWLRPWSLLRIAELQTEGRQWNDSDRTYQESLQSGATAGPGIRRQALRGWAKSFEQRNLWSEAEKYYQQAAGDEGSVPEDLGRAVDLDNIGRVRARRGDFIKAEESFLRSLQIRQELAPGSVMVASSFNSLGNLEADKGNIDKAQDYYRQAQAILERAVPGSLLLSTTLMGLGNVVFDRGDLAEANDYYGRALEIRERIVPGNLDVGKTLNALGNVAYKRGDLSPALEYYRRALAIKQTISPGSLSVAATLANLGNVAHDHGDLAQAEEYYRQDLEITGKLAPGSLDFAGSLMDLGIICQRRGDLIRADEYYRQALEIKKKLAPNGLDLAYTLNNLGSVAEDRGDLIRAKEYYGQALAIRKKLAPESLEVARGLNNIGDIALESGDLVRAEEYNRQALGIFERLAPGNLDAAGTLENLGIVAQRRGEARRAEEYLQRALVLRENIAPLSLAMASGLNRLGSLAKDRGDLDSAEKYYRRALAIQEKLAPGSTMYAESLAAVASILRNRRQLESATQSYAQAIDALENQKGLLGGSEEVRSSFGAQHSDIYRAYVDLLLVQRQPARAFEMLERSRARILLETLAAAHVDIRKGADPSLLEKERSLRESLAAKRDRRLRLLTEKDSEKQVAAFTKEIEDLEKQYQDVEERLRLSSPAYAALTQPQPLSAEQIQKQLLDPETLLLEYSLGDERSHVFVVSHDSLEALELPKRAVIEQAARRLYRAFAPPSSHLSTDAHVQLAAMRRVDAEYRQAASELSAMIVAPLRHLLSGKRLLVVADGALQYIPFGALPSPAATTGTDATSPLIVEHEIVSLPSASVLAEIRRAVAARTLSSQAQREVAVLADPVFDAADERVARVSAATHSERRPGETVVLSSLAQRLSRSAGDIGLRPERGSRNYLDRLLYTRQEARAIVSATPRGQAMQALDFQASRATAMSPELARYRIVHFATHGLADSKHPELSGLVFSLVDRKGRPQDGFLGLDDIYNLNLPVDLVVLSGCQTGMGKEISGEGLIGLTRGFMYAGASRVVASLWNIDDLATSELMARFYRAMEGGKMRPAAALRQAQIEMWKQRAWRSPTYWAGFQIQGEWK